MDFMSPSEKWRFIPQWNTDRINTSESFYPTPDDLKRIFKEGSGSAYELLKHCDFGITLLRNELPGPALYGRLEGGKEQSDFNWGAANGFRLFQLQKEWLNPEAKNAFIEGDSEFFVTYCLMLKIPFEYAVAWRSILIDKMGLNSMNKITESLEEGLTLSPIWNEPYKHIAEFVENNSLVGVINREGKDDWNPTLQEYCDYFQPDRTCKIPAILRARAEKQLAEGKIDQGIENFHQSWLYEAEKLFSACKETNFNELDQIIKNIEERASIDNPYLPEDLPRDWRQWKDESGDHPIHLATSSKNHEAISLILKGNRDLSCLTNATKETPLHCAVKTQDLATVETVLETQSLEPFEMRNSDNLTPIQHSVLEGNTAIIHHLHHFYEKVNRQPFKHQHTLHLLAEKIPYTEQHKNTMNTLVKELGVCTNHHDENNPTPIFIAAQTGNIECVKHLLSLKANPFIPYKGETAHDIASNPTAHLLPTCFKINPKDKKSVSIRNILLDIFEKNLQQQMQKSKTSNKKIPTGNFFLAKQKKEEQMSSYPGGTTPLETNLKEYIEFIFLDETFTREIEKQEFDEESTKNILEQEFTPAVIKKLLSPLRGNSSDLPDQIYNFSNDLKKIVKKTCITPPTPPLSNEEEKIENQPNEEAQETIFLYKNLSNFPVNEKKLAHFCTRFERTFDEFYMFYMALQSGKLQRLPDETDRHLEHFKDMSREMPTLRTPGPVEVGIPTGTIANAALELYSYIRKNSQKEEEQRVCRLFSNVTPRNRTNHVYVCAKIVANRFAEQISQLDFGIEGIQHLADVAVIRIFHYIEKRDETSTQNASSWFGTFLRQLGKASGLWHQPQPERTYEMLDKVIISALSEAKYTSKESNETKLLSIDKNASSSLPKELDDWSAKSIFEICGIVTEKGEYYVPKNAKPSKYGFCFATKEEALERKMTKFILGKEKHRPWFWEPETEPKNSTQTDKEHELKPGSSSGPADQDQFSEWESQRSNSGNPLLMP